MSKNVNVKISADANGAKKEIKSLSGVLNKLSKSKTANTFSSLNNSIGLVSKAFGLVSTAVKKTVKFTRLYKGNRRHYYLFHHRHYFGKGTEIPKAHHLLYFFLYV